MINIYNIDPTEFYKIYYKSQVREIDLERDLERERNV